MQINSTVASNLERLEVSFNIPSGKNIIFDITAIIIPIDTHLIQSNIQLSVFRLDDKITPRNLQRYVAIDDTNIAKIIISLSIIIMLFFK